MQNLFFNQHTHKDYVVAFYLRRKNIIFGSSLKVIGITHPIWFDIVVIRVMY